MATAWNTGSSVAAAKANIAPARTASIASVAAVSRRTNFGVGDTEFNTETVQRTFALGPRCKFRDFLFTHYKPSCLDRGRVLRQTVVALGAVVLNQRGGFEPPGSGGDSHADNHLRLELGLP